MVFFSGTDWSELEDNAPNHNYYLSLIVNNFMDFCAKVCFIAEASNETFSFIAKDESGQKYTATSGEYSVPSRLVVYDCDIDSPKKNIKVQQGFTTRVKHIIEKAERVSANTVRNSSSSTFVKPGESWSNQQESRETDWTSRETTFADTIEEFAEEFTMFVINTGNPIDEFTNIEDVCEMYEASRVTGNMLAGNVANSYIGTYQKYFAMFGDDVEDPELFHKATEEVIWELEHVVETSKRSMVTLMLKPSLEVIKKILKDFNQKVVA